MRGLSDLSFAPGLEFEHQVSQRFHCPVSASPSSHAPPFLLVASFGRYALRLNADSVSLILQATLGGRAEDFHVVHLAGWMFRFSVSSKEVGFWIYKLHKFLCKQFAILFFLWGNGGPNWRRDLALWESEQEAEWTTVGSKGKKVLLKCIE